MMSTNEELLRLLAEEARSNPDIARALRVEHYKKDFNAFMIRAWEELEPGTPLKLNWHLDYLVEEVLSMFPHEIKHLYPQANWKELGKLPNRMTINVPPRTMKTVLISIILPAWLLIHNNRLKIATVSYAQDLSIDINNKRRTLINSDWFVEHFGDVVRPKQGEDRQGSIVLESLGEMYATSVKGTFTGKGADIIILDDPQKPGEMGTNSARQQAIKFFTDTVGTRLNDPERGVLIVIQQRLHTADLTGFIHEQMGEAYRSVVVPAEFTEGPQDFTGRLTGKQWHMTQDQLMWPERLTRTYLDGLRLQLGSYSYSAQLQQSPTPEGGALVSKDWFLNRTYDLAQHDMLAEMKRFDFDRYDRLRLIHSWDMNYTSDNKQTQDFIGFAAGAYDPETDTTWLLEAREFKAGFVDSIKEIEKRYAMYTEKYIEDGKSPVIIIENKANGGPIIEVLQSKLSAVIPFDPGTQNKIARFQSITPNMESGHLWIPSSKAKLDWNLPHFMKQLYEFPMVANDDMVDALTQMMIYNQKQKALQRPKMAIYF